MGIVVGIAIVVGVVFFIGNGLTFNIVEESVTVYVFHTVGVTHT